MMLMQIAVWLEGSDEEFVVEVEAPEDATPTDLDGPIKEWAASRVRWKIEASRAA